MTQQELQPSTAHEISVKGYVDVVVVTNETPHAIRLIFGEQDARVFVRILQQPMKAVEPLWNIPQEYK